MSIATAITWIFNFVVTMSLPAMKGENGLKPHGTLSFYAVWNLIGFLLVLLYVPRSLTRPNVPLLTSTASYRRLKVHCRHQ
jgi:cytochrome b561